MKQKTNKSILISNKKEIRKRSTKLPVDYRRDMAFNLYMKGMVQTDISKKLEVSSRTIQKYIAHKRKILSTQEVKKNAQEIYAEMTHNYRERIRKLWVLLTDRNVPVPEVCSVIRELRAEDSAVFKRAQVIGLLPRDMEFNLIGQQNNQINQQFSVYQTLVEIKKTQDAKEKVVIVQK